MSSVWEGMVRRGRQHRELCPGGLGNVQDMLEETGHD